MSFIQNIGERLETTSSIYNLITSRLKDEKADQFNIIKDAYNEKAEALVPKAGKAPGTKSIFNPWKIFRYSKFGSNQSDYKYEMHFDSTLQSYREAEISKNRADNQYGDSNKPDGQLMAELKPFADNQSVIENPTASSIISWSQANAKNMKTPYASEDFLWCKYYGKIPNNRLVTLRRYPLPVEDNLEIAEDLSPLVPLAQAVTWYGKDIENDLKNILNLSWGFEWKEITADVTNLDGNEIRIDEIIDLIYGKSISEAKKSRMINIIGEQLFKQPGTLGLLQVSGYDKEAQDYIRNAWNSENGPYWNRVLGPVNVIDSTLIRQRGFKKLPDITLNFEYSLRTYGGVNPKIAFLDLLSNFLSLTNNTAPFWGGGLRYFQKTGVTIPGLAINDYMFRGDPIGGIAAGLKQLAATAAGNLESFKKTLQDAFNAAGDDKDYPEGMSLLDSEPFKTYVAQKMSSMIQKPLMFRSMLDGRAIGEWHLTVGNPMSPIAMIGNLVVDDVKLEIGETLGLDDFPTEFKFIVKLKHGRTRDRGGLESIFNLGNGPLSYSEHPIPSSGFNSHGERNTAFMETYRNKANDNNVTENNPTSKETGGATAAQLKSDAQLNVMINNETTSKSTIEALANKYSARVGTMYGESFVNPATMMNYFKDLKTID